MGKGIAAAILILTIIGLVAGGIMLANYVPAEDNTKVTMVIDFTPMDRLAGSQDAATSAADIYRLIDGDLVKQETVTMDAAAKATTNTYTSGETLYLKLYDSTDTSICTQFVKLVVPSADPAAIYDAAFPVALDFVDKGDTAKDILVQYHNNTAIAANAVKDLTNNGWNSDYAEIDIEVRALDDDSGYVNSYNFLRGYDNNHYLVLKASGTGWDSVNLLTGGWQTHDIASARYFCLPLDNNDVTRDKQSDGTYEPDGTLLRSLVFDLTGFSSGDNVTINYEYRWYGSWSHFTESSSWGVDTSATTETFYIQY